jgi:hypothetical protein
VIDCVDPLSATKHLRPVAADNLSLEFIFAEGQALGSADEASADDRDLTQHKIESLNHQVI